MYDLPITLRLTPKQRAELRNYIEERGTYDVADAIYTSIDDTDHPLYSTPEDEWEKIVIQVNSLLDDRPCMIMSDMQYEVFNYLIIEQEYLPGLTVSMKLSFSKLYNNHFNKEQ